MMPEGRSWFLLTAKMSVVLFGTSAGTYMYLISLGGG